VDTTKRTKLKKHEEIIQLGTNGFVQVGRALMAIREEKLYEHAATFYGTFELYCKARWSMTARRANQITSAAQLVDNLRTIVPELSTSREGQVRQLLQLDAPEIVAEVWEEVSAGGGKPTAKRIKEAIKKRQPKPVLPKGLYRVIYSDPPWLYSSMQHATEEQETTLDTHYKQMPTDEIAALPVRKWLPESAVLFLWTTSPKLYEAKEVIDGWGFDYKASIVWDKIKHNVGYYVSVRHELLLICTRGSCLPDVPKLEDSVVSIERGAHSAKPPHFREWIDRMYLPPDGRVDRVEMFPRGDIPEHWDRWGGEP